MDRVVGCALHPGDAMAAASGAHIVANADGADMLVHSRASVALDMARPSFTAPAADEAAAREVHDGWPQVSVEHVVWGVVVGG